jgi:hypothetical protein
MKVNKVLAGLPAPPKQINMMQKCNIGQFGPRNSSLARNSGIEKWLTGRKCQVWDCNHLATLFCFHDKKNRGRR